MIYKRLTDILLSLLLLCLFSWLILVVFIAASADVKRPALFTQTRIGQFGLPFTIFKIQTIHPVYGTISPFGRWLRKYKLDELPQLLNVFIGNMSFVGPRPDVPGYYDTLEGDDRKILELKPGLTSPASIKYYNEDEILASQENPLQYNDEVIFPDKVKMNLEYYRGMTFMGDLRIIWRTMFRK